jgi:uncharacterized protein
MSEDVLNYPRILRDSKRQLVELVLRRFVSEGLPKPHHFYITFSTHHPGVDIDEELAVKYPEEMTIVLEHKFDDLNIEDNAFDVTLRFGGIPKYLKVPLAAITQFSDPSQNFGVVIERFDDEIDTPTEPEDDPDPQGDATIVSLDRFRKKSEKK